mmetsp:Transcript_39436/g.77610  ORF Transcript_39436/g.77610 Transcript_39436/m.77610 type:complete len:130 (-) Transcript_39436:223-612(-)
MHTRTGRTHMQVRTSRQARRKVAFKVKNRMRALTEGDEQKRKEGCVSVGSQLAPRQTKRQRGKGRQADRKEKRKTYRNTERRKAKTGTRQESASVSQHTHAPLDTCTQNSQRPRTYTSVPRTETHANKR